MSLPSRESVGLRVLRRIDGRWQIVATQNTDVRHGRRHDWYRNPTTGVVSQPVPQHREIKDHLARHILTMLGSPPGEAAGDGGHPTS